MLALALSKIREEDKCESDVNKQTTKLVYVTAPALLSGHRHGIDADVVSRLSPLSISILIDSAK
jgi:hypothetical protein